MWGGARFRVFLAQLVLAGKLEKDTHFVMADARRTTPLREEREEGELRADGEDELEVEEEDEDEDDNNDDEQEEYDEEEQEEEINARRSLKVDDEKFEAYRLAKMWKSNKLRMPFYQRAYVWTPKLQGDFLQSIMNMPEIVPEVVFQKAEYEVANASGEKKICRTFEIVDGRQRIQTLVDFMAGKFAWVTKQAKEASTLPTDDTKSNAKKQKKKKGATMTSRYWADLSAAEQDKIRKFEFRARILVGWPGDKVCDAFRAINSGKPLTAAQVLNAGCTGGVKVLRELPEAKEFIEWLPSVGFPSPRENSLDCFLILCRVAVVFVMPEHYTLLTATEKLRNEFEVFEFSEDEKTLLANGLATIRTAFNKECAINNVPELLYIAFCINSLSFESWPAWPRLGNNTSLNSAEEAFKEFGKFYSEEVIKHRAAMCDVRDRAARGSKASWIRDYYGAMLSSGASSTTQRRALTKMAIEKQGKLLVENFLSYLASNFPRATPQASSRVVLKRKGATEDAPISVAAAIQGVYYPPSKEASHPPKKKSRNVKTKERKK